MAVTKIQSKMICPSCKVEMNHHRDKLVYNPDPQEVGAADPTLDAAIAEFSYLPQVWRCSFASRVECLRACPDFPRWG
jgi:hypothetical protein